MGIYLAAGWAVLEFTDWLVNRYVLSPHLIDFALLAWGLMLPTVLMLAWFHGAPGPDGWTKIERLAIPTNLVVAAAILLVAFTGKDLGSATTSVTVADETGQVVERVIPKSDFRKSQALYYFDNVSGDTALDWLQYAIPRALQVDLLQDVFLDVRFGPVLTAKLREEGYGEGLGLPLGLRRDVADYYHLGYFVSGTVARDADQIVVTTSLYETRRGKLIQERSFTGDDVLELVDLISLQLKRDLEIPEQHIEDSKDLPVSEMLTTSIAALRSFTEGSIAAYVDDDWGTAAQHWTEATEEDPTFAYGHLARFEALFLLNQTEQARESLETAMGLLYKMPERQQFAVKSAYFFLFEQDLAKAKAAAGMQAELFPNDLDAHTQLANFHLQENETDKAVREFARILELDPGRIDILRTIGSIYEQDGDFEAALDYYQRYAEEAPNDPRSFTSLGGLHRTLGDHEAAKREYERASITDPDNVSVQTALGDLEADVGNFDAALAYYEDALEAAVTSDQKAAVYNSLRFYYEWRGQPRRSIEYMHMRWAEFEKSQPEFYVLQQKIGDIDSYATAGQADVALDSLGALATRLVPPFDVLLPMGYVGVYLELEDADSIEAVLPGVEKLIDTFGLENLRVLQRFAEGRVLELRGDCEQALFSYRRGLELAPTQLGLTVDIGRCLRELQRYAEALEALQRGLIVRPASPTVRYETARVYAEMGDTEQALENLRVALTTWENAESDFKPAREARELWEQLNSGS